MSTEVMEFRIQYVDLSTIKPNPYQVERRESPEELEDLALSILQYGMVETPVGRPVGDYIEQASGHRRSAAHRLLVDHGHPEFSRLRIRIEDLTDAQMADIVIQENKKRQDIDPIAEARFYRRYLSDFGVTQTELAQRMGVSQSEISNTMRLLDLPDKVQQSIIAREITARHGRELLILKPLPALLEAVVEEVVSEGSGVNATHKLVARKLHADAHPVSDRGWPRPEFDTEECQGCKHRIEYTSPHHDGVKETACGAPECWEKKQKEAEADRAALRRAELELMVAELNSQAPVSGETQGKCVAVGRPAIDVKKAQETKVLDLSKVKYAEYERFPPNDHEGIDEQCQTCEKRVVGVVDKTSFLTKPGLVCLAPLCFQKKMKSLEREHEKVERNAASERLQAFEALLGTLSDRWPELLNRRAILIALLDLVISKYSDRTDKDMVADYGVLPLGKWPRPTVGERFNEKTDKELVIIIVRELYLRRALGEQYGLHCQLAGSQGLAKPQVSCRRCNRTVDADDVRWMGQDRFICTECDEMEREGEA